ncbi:MAG: PD-(D/E)XK nuclease family protein [bacterium]
MIALSWSRLNGYLLCPRKFEAQYIDKSYPDDSDNPNFVRGNRLHKQMEDYIVFKSSAVETFGQPPQLSPEAHGATPIVDKVFDNYDEVYPELQLACDHQWKRCDWFAPPRVVKYRCIIDCLAIRDNEALCIDFKTGKVRDYADDHGQLHLTAAMVMNLYPQVERVTCAYLFLDHKQTVNVHIMRDELEAQMEYFNNMHTEVNEADKFPPLKNQYCGFCLIKEDCPVYRR